MKVHVLCEPPEGEDGDDVQNFLMLHCAGFHGVAYRRIATELSDRLGGRCRVLAPDFRGHGDTPRGPKASFTWYQMADDLVAEVESRKLVGRCVVLGHSLGAVVCLIAEIQNPGLFRGLWCFEPVLFASLAGLKYSEFFAEKAKARRSRFQSYGDALENFGGKVPMNAFDGGCLADYVRGGFRESRDGGGVELKCEPQTESWTYLAGIQTYHRGINDKLKEVTCPVVLSCGSNVGRENEVSRSADIFWGRFRLGRLERYGDLGHFGPFQRPDLVATRLLAFLRCDVEGAAGLPSYLHWNLGRKSKL